MSPGPTARSVRRPRPSRARRRRGRAAPGTPSGPRPCAATPRCAGSRGRSSRGRGSGGCARSGRPGTPAPCSGRRPTISDRGATPGFTKVSRMYRLGSRGSVGVVRKVAALGGDEDLVSPRRSALEGRRERPADRPLALLPAVVDRGVEHVDSRLQRAGNRRLVSAVDRVALLPEVRAEPEGGEREARGLAEVAGRSLRAVGEASGSFERGAAGDHAGEAISCRLSDSFSVSRLSDVASIQESQVRIARSQDRGGVGAQPVLQDRPVVRAEVVRDGPVPVRVEAGEIRRAAVDPGADRVADDEVRGRRCRGRSRWSRCPVGASRTPTTS